MQVGLDLELQIVDCIIVLNVQVLSFINLRMLEPATYRMLINVRVLTTGLFLQFFFSKRLAPKQWGGLCLLVVGCVVEQMGSFHLSDGIVTIVFIVLQASASSLGGIYFQWLLQREDGMTCLCVVCLLGFFLFF